MEYDEDVYDAYNGRNGGKVFITITDKNGAKRAIVVDKPKKRIIKAEDLDSYRNGYDDVDYYDKYFESDAYRPEKVHEAIDRGRDIYSMYDQISKSGIIDPFDMKTMIAGTLELKEMKKMLDKAWESVPDIDKPTDDLLDEKRLKSFYINVARALVVGLQGIVKVRKYYEANRDIDDIGDGYGACECPMQISSLENMLYSGIDAMPPAIIRRDKDRIFYVD